MTPTETPFDTEPFDTVRLFKMMFTPQRDGATMRLLDLEATLKAHREQVADIYARGGNLGFKFESIPTGGEFVAVEGIVPAIATPAPDLRKTITRDQATLDALLKASADADAGLGTDLTGMSWNERRKHLFGDDESGRSSQ